MLLTDLGTAYGQSFQPTLVDEGGGETACGALEGAARAGVLQGLLALALVGQVIHSGLDGGRVAGLEFQDTAGDDLVTAGEGAGAVAQVLFLPTADALLPRLGQVVGLHQHVFQLTAVSTGVHDDAAPQGAGDTGGELQTGQAVLQGKARQASQADAGAAGDGGLVQQLQLGQAAGGLEDEAVHGFILTEQVGAVAQQVGGDARLPCRAQGFRQGLL